MCKVGSNRCAGKQGKADEENKSSFFPVSLCRPPEEGVSPCIDLGLALSPAGLELSDLFARVSWDKRDLLPCLGLNSSWPLYVKIFMSRSRSEACVFQLQEVDHRRVLHFWIVVHSRWSQAANKE